MKNKIALVYQSPQADRWVTGDHRWRAPIRRLIRGPDPIGGVGSVFKNLVQGLLSIGIPLKLNPPWSEIRPSDWVGVVGRGRQCLSGYDAGNPIVTGVAVVSHPSEWPSMFEDLPIACNVVHSEWVQDIYVPWYGSSRIRKWAVGIDTERWAVSSGSQAKVDFLIYDKILWEADRVRNSLLRPMLRLLDSRGLTWATIKYGSYRPDDLRLALSKAKALLFLCEHESQGLAYQQAMSSGVPVLAWSPGQWLDPVRFACGEVNTASTSVPFFDERCGVIFSSLLDFPEQLEVFCDKLRRGVFRPRDYVLENLTLAGCALRYVHILREFNA